jgi:hypothetical protein
MQEECYPAPHWPDWLIRDLWRLDHAIALSLSIDPDALWEGRAVRRPGDLVRLLLLPDEYFGRLALARSCTGLSLPVRIRLGRTGNDGEVHVEPAQFANWLRVKELEIPQELQRLISDRGPAARTASPIAEPAANKPGARGRKPGSGRINDEERLLSMLHLLATSKVLSVLAAAKAIAATIERGQSVNANVARLRRKFAKKWGTSPRPPSKTWADVERELHEN